MAFSASVSEASSHDDSDSLESAIGMRVWMSAAVPTASRVRIEQENTELPSSAVRCDIKPAKATNSLSWRWIRYGCFAFVTSPVVGLTRSTSRHSYQPTAGTRQRALAAACLHIGFVAASSERALKQWPGALLSFHQNGIKPQRAATSSNPSLPTQSIGTVAVGETLKA